MATFGLRFLEDRSMPTITTNDLKIWNGSEFNTPSQIQVYNGSTFGNVSNVYVRKDGSWVQSWPAITSNVVFSAFTPDWVFIGRNGTDDDIYYANLNTNTWSYVGRTGFVSANRIRQLTLGSTGTSTEITYSTVVGGKSGSTPEFAIYANLDTTVANTTAYHDPDLQRTYTVGSGYQITDYTFINTTTYADDYFSLFDGRSIHWCGNNGNVYYSDNLNYQAGNYGDANVWPASFSYTTYPCVVVPLTCQSQGQMFFGNSGAFVIDNRATIVSNLRVHNPDTTTATNVASNAFSLVNLGVSYNFKDCAEDQTGASTWIVGDNGAIMYVAFNYGGLGFGNVWIQATDYTGSLGSNNLTHVMTFTSAAYDSSPRIIVVGENGYAMKANRGLEISNISTGTSNTLRAVGSRTPGSPDWPAAPTADTEIIIAGDGGYILRSTNGSNTWSTYGSPYNVSWRAVYPYLDPGTGLDQRY